MTTQIRTIYNQDQPLHKDQACSYDNCAECLDLMLYKDKPYCIYHFREIKDIDIEETREF